MGKNGDNSLGERIRTVRRKLDLTQKEFADSLGIAQGYLSNIERGRQTPSDTLMIALRYLYRIDADWLATGEGSPESGESRGLSPAFGADRIPLLKKISPDFTGELKEEEILGYIELPECSPECYALLAYGDFMAPTIQDEDLVLFRPGGKPVNGKIVLVNSKWGDVILRRYRVNEDGAWLSPDNSAYTPFQPEPNTRILGIVSGVWRRMKL